MNGMAVAQYKNGAKMPISMSMAISMKILPKKDASSMPDGNKCTSLDKMKLSAILNPQKDT